MTECHVISLLFLTFYVLTVSHCTKKFHLFLITSDGSLDHLNCRAWVRAFGSGSLKLLCCLSVKLCLCLNAQNCCPLLFQQSNNRPPKNTSGRFYGTCLPLARHLPNFNQGDKKKGKLRKGKKLKGKKRERLMSLFLSVRDQPGNKYEELCIQH